MNYQSGTTLNIKRLTVSGDVYYIDNSNAIQSYSNAGGQTIFTNAGVARYKGFESEATYYLGSGFSVYGNYTRNMSSIAAQNAPNNTAAAGLIYQKGRQVYASLMAKQIGARYSGFNAVDANGNPINPIHMGAYSVVNFAVSYSVKNLLGEGDKYTKFKLKVNNLLNKTGIVQSAGGFTDANNLPLFYTLAGRSFMASVSTQF